MNTLQNYKNKPLFEVPEQYFEQFHKEVMQRVAKENRRQNITKKWISAVSIAASFALIVGLSLFLFLNRNINDSFYVHEDNIQQDKGLLCQDSSFLAEVTNVVVENPDESVKTIESPKTSSVETIVYHAVDYYLEDYTTDSFCEAMYDLECFYDY